MSGLQAGPDTIFVPSPAVRVDQSGNRIRLGAEFFLRKLGGAHSWRNRPNSVAFKFAGLDGCGEH